MAISELIFGVVWLTIFDVNSTISKFTLPYSGQISNAREGVTVHVITELLTIPDRVVSQSRERMVNQLSVKAN